MEFKGHAEIKAILGGKVYENTKTKTYYEINDKVEQVHLHISDSPCRGCILFIRYMIYSIIENCHICDQDQEQHRADVGETDRGGGGQGPQAPGHRRRLHRLQGH